MIRSLLLIVLAAQLLGSCRKTTYEPAPADIGFFYLPLSVGSEFIYKADSLKYGFNGTKPTGDTVSFYIKESVELKTEDSTKTVYTIARYHSKDTIHWLFVKNHYYEVEKSRINHKENNLITTPLVFPVLKYYKWNGNEFNTLGPKEYEYSMLNFDYSFKDKTYHDCLKVLKDSTDNIAERRIEYEIFSRNIGLAYSENTDVSLINNDSLDDKGNVVLRRPPKIDKGIIFKKGLIGYK